MAEKACHVVASATQVGLTQALGALRDIPVEQLERARRYLDRLRSLYGGIFTTSDDRDLYEDDAISFFMHCYHVRDWIIHLNKVGITASQVDEFINSHNEMKICADLCNGSKHCRLERNIRSGRQPHIAGKSYDTSTWLAGSGGGNVVKGRYTVITASGTIDALDLAERCMALWSEFIATAPNNSFKPNLLRSTNNMAG